MTPEKLLLIDLCARLPYDVKVWVKTHHGQIIESDFLTLCNSGGYYSTLSYEGILNDSIVKPYLRPMESMTEEELHEVQEILGKGVEIRDTFISIVDSSRNSVSYLELQAVFNYFNAHHLDYHGLIPKDLAIEVTKENNPYKD